jgi:hypothetical protein
LIVSNFSDGTIVGFDTTPCLRPRCTPNLLFRSREYGMTDRWAAAP